MRSIQFSNKINNNNRIDSLSKALVDMEVSDEQKANIAAFLEEKKKIVQQGEMKEQHFLRMAELGFGNGGVVLKVEHKPTGIIMARKVLHVQIQ